MSTQLKHYYFYPLAFGVNVLYNNCTNQLRLLQNEVYLITSSEAVFADVPAYCRPSGQAVCASQSWLASPKAAVLPFSGL